MWRAILLINVRVLCIRYVITFSESPVFGYSPLGYLSDRFSIDLPRRIRRVFIQILTIK